MFFILILDFDYQLKYLKDLTGCLKINQGGKTFSSRLPCEPPHI
ncbi:MAG: hypothetical protein AAF806_03320 [Bacteroidota bacterium]